jgi:hypothetical protein
MKFRDWCIITIYVNVGQFSESVFELYGNKKKKKTPWSESASELYRLNMETRLFNNYFSTAMLPKLALWLLHLSLLFLI